MTASRIEQLAEGVTLYPGDCLHVLASLPDNSVDSCVTDPPYGLEFMGKEWDRFSGAIKDRDFKGFVLSQQRTRNVKCPECGKWAYDHPGRQCACGGIRRAQGTAFQFFCEAWARQVFRVLKPGANLLAFGGTRTYHRMACAIEDAGFEIRDSIQWLYGSGFPKSLDVSKAIDKAARGVPQGGADPTSANHGKFKGGCTDDNPGGRGFGAGPGQFMREAGEANDRELVTDALAWSGFGTALKPACEPIVLARKPLSESTVAANVLKWGTGALNIDGCRVASGDALGGGGGTTPVAEGWDRPFRHDPDSIERHKQLTAEKIAKAETLGRWPANVIHDGSDEVVGAFPDRDCGMSIGRNRDGTQETGGYSGGWNKDTRDVGYNDSGSAARFFYSSKADQDDRLGSKHPTVKPVDLVQYLVRLVTPKGGTVLDCFAGTGTLGEACIREGMRAILIEREVEYCDDIRRRMRLAMSGPDERSREAVKARNKDKPVDAGPLFGASP